MTRRELNLVIVLAIGWFMRSAIGSDVLALAISFLFGAAVMAITALLAPTCAEDCPEAQRRKRKN